MLVIAEIMQVHELIEGEDIYKYVEKNRGRARGG